MRSLSPGGLELGRMGGRKTTSGELAASLPWRFLWPKDVCYCLPSSRGLTNPQEGLL